MPRCGRLKQFTVSVTAALVWMNCFQYYRKYVFKGPWWTIYSWYCVFVLYFIVPHFNASFANALHFFTLCGLLDQNALTVLNCHTILIKNIYRLLCKSMLPTMVIKMCVKLKYIFLASYVRVKELTPNLDAALSWVKSPLNCVNFSPWISFKLLEFRLGKNVWTL